MAAVNGGFLLANGVFMLTAPMTWYYLVPGVTDTGFFNQHFIRDIGIIQIFLGAAFGIGVIRPAHRFELWAGASLWLVALPISTFGRLQSASVLRLQLPAIFLL